MKLVITGGNGFLGKFIRNSFVGEVVSIGRGEGNDLKCDLTKEVPVIPENDMVVHNAGKAHVVPKSKQEEEEFFEVNVIGTKNLLAGLDLLRNLPKCVVFISTVAVYGKDTGILINEKSKLEGNTPYAKSKIEAEKLILDWGNERNVNVVVLRLPLVIGLPNPPGNLGAMISGIQKGRYARVGDGNFKKSMVLATDVASLIPKLVDQVGIFNLTDRVNPTLAELDSVIANSFGKKVIHVPLKLLKVVSRIGDVISFFPLNTYRLKKLTANLTFDDQLAFEKIGWSPRPVLEYLKSNLNTN